MMGNLLLVMVHSAAWSDLEGGTWLLLEGLRRIHAVLKGGPIVRITETASPLFEISSMSIWES